MSLPSCPVAPDGSLTCYTPVGTATLGAGRWGQLDLAGDVWEWMLDWYTTYVDPCIDCSYLTATGAGRVFRGGGWSNIESSLELFATDRQATDATYRESAIGFRCARTP
jgi:sulfatase modifying factor 1